MHSAAKLVLGAAAAALLILAATCGSSSPAKLDGRWLTDLDLATARAEAEQKPLLVAFRCEA